MNRKGLVTLKKLPLKVLECSVVIVHNIYFTNISLWYLIFVLVLGGKTLIVVSLKDVKIFYKHCASVICMYDIELIFICSAYTCIMSNCMYPFSASSKHQYLLVQCAKNENFWLQIWPQQQVWCWFSSGSFSQGNSYPFVALGCHQYFLTFMVIIIV